MKCVACKCVYGHQPWCPLMFDAKAKTSGTDPSGEKAAGQSEAGHSTAQRSGDAK